jgi:O-antigen ligase
LEILLVWTGISIFWSQFSTIAFFRYFSIIGLVSFVYISTRQLQRANWLNLAIYALLINGLFQSILGIAQFIHNGSLGLRFIGESIVGPEIDGVAKILINGERHIRAYGTLPHPNILAGFLLVPLFLILAELAFRKIWGTHQYSYSQATLSNQTTDTPDDATLIKVSHETLFGKYSDRSLCIFGTIVACAFLLTFSRSALLAAFIGFLAFLIWVSRRTNLNYSTILSKKSFKSKLLVSTMLLVSIFIVEKQTSLISTQSLKERNLYNIVSYETILQHPIRGIGVGQFIMNEYAQHPDLEGWQYQPVHNVYLLILSELGIVGAILAAIATLSLVFKIYGSLPSPRAPLTYILFCCILLSFTIIGLFDHYLYDIGPGMNLLAVVFSLLLSQTGALKTNKLPTNSMR